MLTRCRLTGDERRVVRPGVPLGAEPACAAAPRPHSNHQPTGQETRRLADAHKVLICTVSGLRELGPTTASNGGSAGVLPHLPSMMVIRDDGDSRGQPRDCGSNGVPFEVPALRRLVATHGWAVALVRGWLLCRMRLTGIVSLGGRWPGPLEPDPQPGEVRCGH